MAVFWESRVRTDGECQILAGIDLEVAVESEVVDSRSAALGWVSFGLLETPRALEVMWTWPNSLRRSMQVVVIKSSIQRPNLLGFYF